MPSTVLILGAAGRIGSALTTAFADAGWNVRAQSRKPLPASAGRRSTIETVHCDALDAAALRTAARGAGVVVHALNPPYTQWDRLALPLADAAISAARAAGALLMLPGNVYNFGRELPAVLTPATPERGDVPKARLRIDTEARMAAVPGLDSVVIRAGDFFGGERGSWFDLALASRIAAGRFIYPGDPAIEHAWAYLPDLAQAFVQVAARRDGLRGPHRFHFAGHTATGLEFKQALQQAIGRPLRMGGLPWGAIRAGAWLVPMWRELVTMRYLWQRAHRLEDPALPALVGALPHTPLAQAVAQSLRRLGLAQPSDPALSASARA
jgi:nucleoside-diphosphate-sugar epimerase